MRMIMKIFREGKETTAKKKKKKLKGAVVNLLISQI